MTGGAIGLDSLLSSFGLSPREATRISKKALGGLKIPREQHGSDKSRNQYPSSTFDA